MIFLSYFKNHKGLFAIDVLSAVGIALIDLMFPLVTRTALYNWLPDQLYRTFFTVMIAVLVCYVLRSILSFVVAYFGHTFGIRVEADIRRDLFKKMQEMSFDFYDQNRTGVLMSRLTTDLFDLIELAHHGPEDLLTSVLTIIGALIVMFSVRWELALIVAVTIPVFLIVIMSMRKNMSRASALTKEKTGHINQEIETSLSGFRTAKAFANEAVENARFTAANEVYKNSKRGFHKAMGFFHSSMEFFLCSLNVVIIGVGCWGKLDPRKLGEEGILDVAIAGDVLKISSLYGDETVAYKDAMLERCHVCKGKEHMVYDELIGESADTIDADRFDEVAKIEAMSPEEKFAYFQSELSKCIRCNACRNVCPACSCRKCVFDSTKFDSAQKANTTSFEEKIFNIIRAFHVSGRCTDCGECSRVCPQGIPLPLFNRKFIKDINTLYGEYPAGRDLEEKMPLTSFTLTDAEPGRIYGG